MARSKKGRAAKAARYKAVVANAAASTSRHTTQDIASYFQPRVAAAQKFSLADEARHTAHNHGSPESHASLRGRPVTFVSAGVVEPLKELDDELIATDSNPAKNQLEPSRAALSDIAIATVLHDAAHDSPDGVDMPTFFIDTAGDKSLAQPRHEPVSITSSRPRPPSSSGSSSGADQVVFKGRNRQKQQQQRRHPIVTDEITIQVHNVEQTLQHISLDSAPNPSSPREHTSTVPKSPPIPAWQLRGHNDDDELVADYIANMDVGDDEDDEDQDEGVQQFQAGLQPSFGARDLGGSDGDIVLPEESTSSVSSADDDENEQDDDDDQGAREENLDIEDDLQMPEADEAAFAAAGAANEISDEAMARLLAKQDELGFDEDELVIASEETARYNNRFVATSNSRIAEFRERVEAPWMPVKKGARGMIPSAGAVADVFDSMDLAMDWERHNPARKSKAKQGQPIFDLSDPEMEAHLQATFKKDRQRKTERKHEREQLRAAGLLGKHGNPEDLRIKYPTGITIDEIKEEMRTFLQGDAETLTFPPMDANARKSIHEICLRLSIKSKSTGGGDQRRPILHRTKRTGIYREAAFETAFARPGRRYFHRLDINKPRGGRGGGGAGRPNGRGVNTAAFTYRDGEVVGGGAPELAANNKGRALMEKMGWSAGMALGANDNQGILQPVPHVVKRTKAGLG